jgi:hypothetical protein
MLECVAVFAVHGLGRAPEDQQAREPCRLLRAAPGNAGLQEGPAEPKVLLAQLELARARVELREPSRSAEAEKPFRARAAVPRASLETLSQFFERRDGAAGVASAGLRFRAKPE